MTRSKDQELLRRNKESRPEISVKTFGEVSSSLHLYWLLKSRLFFSCKLQSPLNLLKAKFLLAI